LWGGAILPGKQKASGGANYTREKHDSMYPADYHCDKSISEAEFAQRLPAKATATASPSIMASLASGTAIKLGDSPDIRAGKKISRQNLMIAELQAENRELKEAVSGMQSKLVDLHEATRVLRVTAANIARAANEQADAVNYFEHVQEHEFHDDTIDMAKQTRSDIVNRMVREIIHAV